MSIQSPTTPRPVHVHIERLVLEDWPSPLAAAQRAQLEAAVVAAITRQVAAGGLAPGLVGGGALAVLRGGTIQLGPGTSPAALGAAIGGATADPLQAQEAPRS